MPFRTRNPYYIRISQKDVLPLYLYLDERHIDWMSDRILQHVLADIRPNIIPKLKAESEFAAGGPLAKTLTVDTHRGDTYQFCYFIRKTEPHAVLIKTRHFLTALKQPQALFSEKRPQTKRKNTSSKDQIPSEISRKKRKTKGRKKAITNEDEELAITSDDDDQAGGNTATRIRRSTRRNNNKHKESNTGVSYGADSEMGIEGLDKVVSDTANLVDPRPASPGFVESSSTANDAADDLVNDDTGPETQTHSTRNEIDLEIEEEEKPKPILQLRYKGFNIYGHCLCIVVEPWPSMRTTSRTILSMQGVSRTPSIAPETFTAFGNSSRAKTPLFLPEDGGRGETPIPSFNDPIYDHNNSDSDMGGMMEFSVVLNAAGDFPGGAANDNEDMDSTVLFGDADETKEF